MSFASVKCSSYGSYSNGSNDGSSDSENSDNGFSNKIQYDDEASAPIPRKTSENDEKLHTRIEDGFVVVHKGDEEVKTSNGQQKSKLSWLLNPFIEVVPRPDPAILDNYDDDSKFYHFYSVPSYKKDNDPCNDNEDQTFASSIIVHNEPAVQKTKRVKASAITNRQFYK